MQWLRFATAVSAVPFGQGQRTAKMAVAHGAFARDLVSEAGLLLGEAVDGAEAPDEFDAVDADDFVPGEV